MCMGMSEVLISESCTFLQSFLNKALEANGFKHMCRAVSQDNQDTSEEMSFLTLSDESDEPVRFGALLDKINALYHAEQMRADVLSFGPYVVQPARLRLLHVPDDKTISLTEKEVQILSFLIKADDDVSRDVLLEKLWGYKEGLETHTLETHIYRLRQKIEPTPSDPSWLITTERGYRIRS